MPVLPAQKLPLLPACLCAGGIAFCSWVLSTGGSTLCVTDGCSLFRDFSIAGFSLWDVGLAFFSALLLLCLLRLTRLARAAAGLALAADVMLLGVMLFTAPCVNCLVAGALLAFCYLALRSACDDGRPRGASLLAMLWAAFFLCNAGGVCRDLASPWSPLAHEGQPAVRIWFSPSCPACRQIVSRYGDIRGAAWFPVAENADDVRVIRVMTNSLDRGASLPDAVKQARTFVFRQKRSSASLEMLRPSMLLLQFRLWVNHSHVLASGSDKLPFVEFLGVPSFLREKTAPDAAALPEGQQLSPEGSSMDAPELSRPEVQEPVHGNMPDVPGIPELGVAGFCDGSDPAPCPDEGGTRSRPLIDTGGMMESD